MLAIVIPFYKIIFFEETLASLSNQTHKNFRVYIGNDNSPEDPIAIMERYKSGLNLSYKRFSVNFGGTSLVQQWRRCIAMTDDEEYIMILGDDDVLEENVVEEFYKAYGQLKNFNVIRFSSAKIDGKSTIISKIYKRPKIESSVDFFFKIERSSLSEYIFKKEAIKKVDFRDFPLAWGSDIMAVLEFSDFGKIYSINNAVVQIRYSDINISGRQDNTLHKRNAIRMFYEYLIYNKMKKFRKKQRLILLRRYEGILKTKKNKDWQLLFKLNLQNFELISFSKFIVRFSLFRLKIN